MLSIQELRSSTKKELLKELSVAQGEMQKIRIGVKTKSIKDSSLVTKQRKYIAKIETLIKELDLEEIVKTAAEVQ